MPTEANPDFKEGNITHLVYAIISLVLELKFTLTLGEMYGWRDCEGTEEFIVVGEMTYDKERLILVVEAKRTSLGQGIKQCLLALEGMRDYNGDGKVYGFCDNWARLAND